MKKIFQALKFTGFIVFIALVIVACDQDFNSIESDVIGQKSFNTDHYQLPIVAYNKKLDSLKINNLNNTLLGVFNDPAYGQTTASIVTQITPTLYDPTFGGNPTIDSVILNIPYYSKTLPELDTDGNLTYSISDSLFGSNPIKLAIHRNNYFIRDFDPNSESDITQNYYSNASGTINDTDNFAITENGSINFDNFKSIETIYNNDSFLPTSDPIILKSINSDGAETFERLAPALRAHLDPEFWRLAILEKEGSTELSNANNFKDYFRGLFIKAEAINNEGNMIMLNLANSSSSVTIYYSYDSTITTGERLQSTYTFNFSGNKLNTFINNYSLVSLDNGDPTNGDEKLYLKGAEGSMAVIDILSGMVDCDGTEISALECFKKSYRAVDENGEYILEDGKFVLKKLINEAQLVIYEDESVATGGDSDYHKYDRIYAYDAKNNIPLIDYDFDPTANSTDPLSSKFVHLGQRNTNDNGVPKYKIRITEHLNNILLRDSTNTKIGLVLSTNVNLTTNAPILNSMDGVTGVPEASIITPRGTVLYGSNESAQEKKMTLEVYFTESKEN